MRKSEKRKKNLKNFEILFNKLFLHEIVEERESVVVFFMASEVVKMLRV